MKRAICMLSLAVAGNLWSAASVRAARGFKIGDSPGELYSIENRDLLGSHEISATIGVLPLDAFGTGLTIAGSYTYHFNQLFGWEIIGGGYAIQLGTGLKTQLRDRFQVQPEGETVSELQAMFHSNFVFKPLYGKLALLDKKLISGELFFVSGPALGYYVDGGIPFGFDFGFGMRFFLGSPYFSFRVDVRDYVFIPSLSQVDNHLYLSLGLSLTFGFGNEQSTED